MGRQGSAQWTAKSPDQADPCRPTSPQELSYFAGSPSAEKVKVWSPLPLVAMVGIVFAICGAWRWYQQVEGFKSGLDASEAAFWEKWMPLWYLNLAATAVAQTSVPLYMWLTRDRALSKVTPEVELKRYFLFFAMLVTMTMTIPSFLTRDLCAAIPTPSIVLTEFSAA